MGAVANTAATSSMLLAILYGLAYLTAASSIILLNKHVLSVTPFHFPIALSSLGVLFGWVTSVVLVQTGIVSLEKHKDITFMSWVKTVLPIGFFTGVTLACGNMAYFYLSLSFLQMTKALSPVCLFFILWITGLDRFHMKVFLSILVIVVGTRRCGVRGSALHLDRHCFNLRRRIFRSHQIRVLPVSVSQQKLHHVGGHVLRVPREFNLPRHLNRRAGVAAHGG